MVELYSAFYKEATKQGERCKDDLNRLVEITHDNNKKWWLDLETGEPLDVDKLVPEKLMLIVTELSEALEGHRKNLMDTHLPEMKMFDVEIADALIRLLDLAGAKKINLGKAYAEKMAYNAIRKDHTNEARKAEGGKKY